MIPKKIKITLGMYCSWQANHWSIPGLEHTVAHVVVVGIDVRSNPATVCYLVAQRPPLIACCGINHFRANCTPYGGAPWLTYDELSATIQMVDECIAESVTPGDYAFLTLQLEGLENGRLDE